MFAENIAVSTLTHEMTYTTCHAPEHHILGATIKTKNFSKIFTPLSERVCKFSH
jgi:hypothetical protein